MSRSGSATAVGVVLFVGRRVGCGVRVVCVAAGVVAAVVGVVGVVLAVAIDEPPAVDGETDASLPLATETALVAGALGVPSAR
jgi:hypothetical protein